MSTKKQKQPARPKALTVRNARGETRRLGREWDRAASLKDGVAMTRDRRIVFNLREAVINDGETILVGDVTTKRYYQPNSLIRTEKHYWTGKGAWGSHGGDDLMTVKP